ncbi:MAG: FG-GAP repeat domain-containing protein [Planctomycetota bacterium]
MIRSLGRASLLATLLLLSGCDVVLTLFAVPVQSPPGGTIQLQIAGDISGTTGEGGCVLQLPNGWTILSVTNDRSWTITRDSAALLAVYVAEPGHYLAGFSGTGTGGIGGGQTIPDIRLTITVQVPAAATGAFDLKVSLAGSPGIGAWQIQEPAGVAQFASITAAPYVRRTFAGIPAAVDFELDSTGLPPEATNAFWSGLAFGDVDGDGRSDLAAATGGGVRCWLARPGTTWIERSAGLPTIGVNQHVAFGDFDADGHLDLADSAGRVFWGDGGTGWSPGAPLPLVLAGALYHHVAAGDLDGDGVCDLAFGAPGNGRLQALRSNGDRTFGDRSTGLPTTATGNALGRLLLQDLDGDGDADLLWTHHTAQNLWLGDGAGAWTPGVGIPATATAAAAADLDGDGVPEIVVATDDAGVSAYKFAFGTSWAPLPLLGLPIAGNYRAVAALDFDRDGFVDVAAGRGFAHGGVDLYRHLGPGAGFALHGSAGLPPVIFGDLVDLAVGDFDGNTFPDLAIATIDQPLFGGTDSVRAWQNVRTGTGPFGAGCGGALQPELAPFGAPVRGDPSFGVLVTGTPGQFALFWIGASRTAAPPFDLPLDLGPFGAPGCSLWTSLDQTYGATTSPAGDFHIALPVPNDPQLARATVFAQGAVFAPGANPFGLVFSDALAIRIE